MEVNLEFFIEFEMVDMPHFDITKVADLFLSGLFIIFQTFLIIIQICLIIIFKLSFATIIQRISEILMEEE